MTKFLLLNLLVFLNLILFSQSYPKELKIDSSYNYIQFYSNEVATKIENHFANTANEKLVFVHYGGSHIQAEIPTTIARKKFQDKYGDGGRGLIFNYGAANTYSSVNYSSTFVGDWSYIKIFQGRKSIPLGVCGMSVDTKSAKAELNFSFKSTLETTNSLLYLFFEKDSNVGNFSIWFDSLNLFLDTSKIQQTNYGLIIPCPNSVSKISIQVNCESGEHFTFYGFNIEKNTDQGVIYHSTGVGAAAIRSILVLDKLEQQLPIIEPDIIFLDFGTNDILYTNKIDPSLVGQFQKAITKIKLISPEALIVLTSTQDLFYKGKIITVGPIFRDLVDSIARANNCLYWNWYDLSGGLGTIKTWNSLGYAQADGIHLNTKGYQLKGQKIFESFENTLLKIKETPTISILHIDGKMYEKNQAQNEPIVTSDSIITNLIKEDKQVLNKKETKPKKKKSLNKIYKVRSGDNLSKIAQKFGVTVAALKNKNKLKRDLIKPGQILKIP